MLAKCDGADASVPARHRPDRAVVGVRAEGGTVGLTGAVGVNARPSGCSRIGVVWKSLAYPRACSGAGTAAAAVRLAGGAGLERRRGTAHAG